MEIKYQDYQKLIYARAWNWSLKSYWDFDDLLAEGNLVFCLARNSFNPEKSCFSTWLWKNLEIHYGNLIRKKKIETVDFDINRIPNPDGNSERTVAIAKLIFQMTDDAKLLVKIVLDTPNDLIWFIRKTRIDKQSATVSRFGLLYFMNRQRDWTFQRGIDAIKEIQKMLTLI